MTRARRRPRPWHCTIAGASLALLACTSTTDAPEPVCQPLTITSDLTSEPLAVGCTTPSGSPAANSPCTGGVTQERSFSSDGTSIIRLVAARASADAPGWDGEVALFPDGCASVSQVPFDAEQSPRQAFDASIEVSAIPESGPELETLGGRVVARFDDGIRIVVQF